MVMEKSDVCTLSGKAVSDLNLEDVVNGSLKSDDFRISPETLILQAETAEAAGYRELGLNLRRAAELTGIDNKFIFDIYTMLRPGRSTLKDLLSQANSLENEHRAPLNAALLRETSHIYSKRGLLRAESN